MKQSLYDQLENEIDGLMNNGDFEGRFFNYLPTDPSVALVTPLAGQVKQFLFDLRSGGHKVKSLAVYIFEQELVYEYILSNEKNPRFSNLSWSIAI